MEKITEEKIKELQSEIDNIREEVTQMRSELNNRLESLFQLATEYKGLKNPPTENDAYVVKKIMAS